MPHLKRSDGVKFDVPLVWPDEIGEKVKPEGEIMMEEWKERLTENSPSLASLREGRA